ncbi:hypothetical protein Fmac_002431 [Flemingia macrophylla]|uniref:Uncharacterized protein n=1 Tax=Flemingia macrophylla TaxID=520843 RepID=A0ABD1NJW9_9FABA
MSSSIRIQPPGIVRYFNNVCFKTYRNIKHTFLFKPNISFRTILFEVTNLLTEEAFLVLLNLALIHFHRGFVLLVFLS